MRDGVICESLTELRPYEDAWAELLADTPEANFFQTAAWLKTYWRHFGQAQQLRTVIVHDGGCPTGILPLVIRTEKTKVGPVRFLTYPLDYWGSFYGPIGRDPRGVLRRGLEQLLTGRRDWDLLELRWSSGPEEELGSTSELLRSLGLSPTVSMLDMSAVIDLSGNWEDYFAARGSKWRSNLRRWERRMAERGELRFVRHRSEHSDSDPRWDLFDQCIEVARRSWQGSSQTGTTISHGAVSAFIRDMHASASGHGGADLGLLYLDRRPIAFAYNYTYRGHVFGLRVGYDPEFKAFGIGNLLYIRMIEDSFARGDWRYDLGPGSLQAKRQIRSRECPIYRVSCFQPRSIRQQLLRWKRQHDMRTQGKAADLRTAR